jgi:hypothetical protein
MLAKRATLALLAVRALSALASPVQDPGIFTVQDSGFHTLAPDSIGTDAESANPLDSNPEVRIDDGVFVGYRKAQTDHFLGIPFALPP